MDDEIKQKINYLRLNSLVQNWDSLITEGELLSQPQFLKHVVDVLYGAKVLKARSARLSSAKIPDPYVMATYPFSKQPKLNKKKVVNLHDSLDYMTKKQNVILVGPTGTGKTGLGTSYLTQAILSGYRGRFITFPKLISELYKSIAAHKEERVLRAFAGYDCLLIDELGYVDIEPAQVGLFFRLMSMRHRSKTTIVSSNLGFQEWGSFLKNAQLTSALLDRLTENSHIINMRNCVSIRPKPIYTDKNPEHANSVEDEPTAPA